MANTHERLVNLYALLGTAYGVLGKSEESADAFTHLLAIDPDHHLPRGLSPKITRPFQEAGGYWLDRPGGLAVTPTMPREIAAGKPVTDLGQVGRSVEDGDQRSPQLSARGRRPSTPSWIRR